MLTTWDKAIAAFLTAIVTTLAVLNIDVSWLTPAMQTAIVGLLTGLVTWLVPNKTA